MFNYKTFHCVQEKYELILILFFIVFIHFPAYSNMYLTKPKEIITIGRTSEDIHKEHDRIGPIINYLAERLTDLGVKKGKVIIAGDNNNSTLVKYFRENKIDLAIDSIFPAIVYYNQVGARPILLGNRKGRDKYCSFIFVRKDSGIESIQDLKGKIIAFEDPGSTSAYLLPKLILQSHNLILDEIISFNTHSLNTNIGYMFAGSEYNVSSWVFFKKVHAGALSNLDWNDPEDVPNYYSSDLKIIYRGIDVPSILVVARKGLDQYLIHRIKNELINMHQTVEGKKALKNSTFGINQFKPLKNDPLKGIIDMINKTGWTYD